MGDIHIEGQNNFTRLGIYRLEICIGKGERKRDFTKTVMCVRGIGIFLVSKNSFVLLL